MGIGELVVNSIDLDGTRKGYDLEFLNTIRSEIPSIPITFLGGAGSIDDIVSLQKNNQAIGAGAGSLFVFKGKFNAVLINYPTVRQKKEIYDLIGK